MNNNLFSYNSKCPLCNSLHSVNIKSSYYNVYSELISKELNIDEEYLLSHANQKRCESCQYTYWGRPLSKNITRDLYTRILPIHPKGDDSTGKYFSLKGLEKKLEGLDLKSTKRSRIVDGYISSIKFQDTYESDNFIRILNKIEDISKINLSDKKFLSEVFDRGPVAFSRHAGFRDTFLNKFIKSKIKKNNTKYEYIEYGCCDWGPIKTLSMEGYKCINVVPTKYEFWDCSQNNDKDCFNYDLVKDLNNLNSDLISNNCFLNLILILDHVHDPINFINKFLGYGVNQILIMLEKISPDKGLPIQHISGWNEQSLKKFSEIIGFEINFFDEESNNYLIASLSRKN